MFQKAGISRYVVHTINKRSQLSRNCFIPNIVVARHPAFESSHSKNRVPIGGSCGTSP